MNFQVIQTDSSEHDLFFSQTGKDKALGCIGHLRGDFGNGKQFYSSWFDHRGELKSKAFKKELDEVVNFLRENPDCPVLRSRGDMAEFCWINSNSRIEGAWHEDVFGFKVQTAAHSYYLRCFPLAGDYNFYCYCYNNARLFRELGKNVSQNDRPKNKEYER